MFLIKSLTTRAPEQADGDGIDASRSRELGTNIHSTGGPVGLRILADPPEPSLDIIFVHGLTGNRETTWTHPNGTFWPRDLLPQALPNVRIMTFGYDADVVRIWATASSNALYDHGKSLDYQLNNARPRLCRRPILFVAHSLGGLVCEQALLLSDATREPHSIASNTVGIIFMGTPHSGSSLAIWGSMLAKLTNNFRATNKEIVATLKRGSADLQRVGEEFQRLLHRSDIKMRVVCFYEELPMPALGKIVESESAILKGYKSCSIHADHRSMTKFDGCTDMGYQQVHATLGRWMEEMQEHQVGIREQDAGHAGPGSSSPANNPCNANTSTSGSVFHSYGSVSGRNVFHGQQVNGGTNTWSFS